MTSGCVYGEGVIIGTQCTPAQLTQCRVEKLDGELFWGPAGNYSLGFMLLGGAVGVAALLTLTLRRTRTLAPVQRTPEATG